MKIFFLILLFSVNIKAQELRVDKERGNQIKFFAEATFNDFEGITNSIEGSIKLKNNLKNSEINFKVNLDSLDTGIGLRNKHMREILETEKFPFAEFKGTIDSVDSISSINYNLKVEGVFSVHGTSKKIIIAGKLYNFGSLKKIKASFDLLLSDFKIERPSFLFNKVADKVKVSVLIYLR